MITPNGFGIAANSLTIDQLNLLKGIGTSMIRLDLGWDNIELSPGVYSLSSIDTQINNIIAAGMRPILILDYNCTLYVADKFIGVTTGNSMTQWLDMVAYVTNRYKNKNIIYEIWNEPNSSSFWRNTSYDEYAALVKTTAPVIRANDPTAYIVGPSLSQVIESSQTYLANFLGSSSWGGENPYSYLDAIAVHPYIRTNPEDAIAPYSAIRDIMQAAGDINRNFPLFDTEWGWSSLWNPSNAPNLGWQCYPPVTSEVQATYFARKYVIDCMLGIVGSIWFTYGDTGSLNITFEDDGFGVLDSSNVPKPLYFEMIRLAKILGKTYVRNISNVDGDYIIQFSKDGEPSTFACWSLNTGHSFTFPLPNRFQASATPASAIPASAIPANAVPAPAASNVVNLSKTITYVDLYYEVA